MGLVRAGKQNKTMLILGIDPQVEQSAGAIYSWTGGQAIKLVHVGMFSTDRFIRNPGSWFAIPPNTRLVAVIEGQYVAKSVKAAFSLSRAADRMDGALTCNGFKVYDAPVWGKNPWLESLRVKGLRPTRENNKKISMQLAKRLWPTVANTDEADAINIVQWWWANNKHRYLGG
jgi:hypothetical protein